ncbi:hypothetical protein L2Y90_27730 [Burkholderia pyrrocinia]|uniref:hypothetical protein n=1 Tax=Burkholderia pyrrocinia TaxID=60550 RepID=UPI00215A9EED|nr:hypothetical protein [Burkholderia pyrrocinia]UVE67905.1 hypothetical protein L2Y90_27730 [Burkholderia pyrrocinia]
MSNSVVHYTEEAVEQRNHKKGIGDVKGLTWNSPSASERANYFVKFYLTHRQKVCLIAALLLAWAFLHVALYVILA